MARKIQRADVNKFLVKCDQSKPIIPVILDDSGLPEDNMGKKYVRALFSNPKKMGVRCVVSNKCERFLQLIGEDEELREKVEFVNIYLADGIQNTADGEKKCTIYIMPDYSIGKRMLVSFFRVFRKYISKKKVGLKEWVGKKKKMLAVFGVSVVGMLIFMYHFIEFLGEMENLKIIRDTIGFLWKEFNAMNTGVQIVLTACIVAIFACFVIQDAVRNADKACAQACGKQEDNFVFLLPSVKGTDTVSFERRWLDRNGFYREVETEMGKKKKFFYYGDCKKPLSSKDDMSPEKMYELGENAQDGYRFLLAVLEHYSSLEQETIIKHYPTPH